MLCRTESTNPAHPLRKSARLLSEVVPLKIRSTNSDQNRCKGKKAKALIRFRKKYRAKQPVKTANGAAETETTGSAQWQKMRRTTFFLPLFYTARSVAYDPVPCRFLNHDRSRKDCRSTGWLQWQERAKPKAQSRRGNARP